VSNRRRILITLVLFAFALGMLLAAACPVRAADAPARWVTFSGLANAPGAYGSYWRTEFAFANGSDSVLTVRLADPQPGIGRGILIADVQPGETWATGNLLGDLGYEGAFAGMFQIFGDPEAATKASISVRTYTTNSQGGTYGVVLPALEPLSITEPKSIALLSAQTLRRTFYYYMWKWAPFNAVGYDGAGRKVWEITPSDLVAGHQADSSTISPALRGIQLPMSVARITITAAGRPSPADGFVIVYATQADNLTNAPVFLP